MGYMQRLLCGLLLLSCFHSAVFSNPSSSEGVDGGEAGGGECVIELTCAECLPEHMPVVTSHGGAGGAVRAARGEEVVFSCAGGKFVQYPLLGTLSAACEGGGRYRVRHDHALRALLDLGCQDDVFEDVLHHVEECSAPLQGRAYQMREPGSAATRHLAAVCWDADRGVAVWARASSAPRNALPLPPHAERTGPRSLLGNFNHMFDASTRAHAERLYASSARMTRRARELMKHDRFTFAGQTLAAGHLLAADYYEAQNARVTEFPSNLVPVWASVAAGNLHHLQRDVARLLRRAHSAPGPAPTLEVITGTHGVGSLRAEGVGEGEVGSRREVWLGGARFPAPRYVWTVVEGDGRALALVLLNDPFVSVSEVRASVFCESACGRADWLHHLRRHRNYEVPLYGLVFCCGVHELAATVALPPGLLARVPPGPAGVMVHDPTL